MRTKHIKKLNFKKQNFKEQSRHNLYTLHKFQFLLLYELTNFKSPQLLAIQLSSTNSFTFFSNCLIFSSGLLKKKAGVI